MELQNQVTSLELSKRLKELNVKQESLFYWVKTVVDGNENWDLRMSKKESLELHLQGKLISEYYSAFTASELWEKMSILRAETKTDSYAKMLIYFTENKIIPIKEFDWEEGFNIRFNLNPLENNSSLDWKQGYAYASVKAKNFIHYVVERVQESVLYKNKKSFWELAIRDIRTFYGANCELKDTDEFPHLKGNTHARCTSCRAKEVVEWIEEHILQSTEN